MKKKINLIFEKIGTNWNYIFEKSWEISSIVFAIGSAIALIAPTDEILDDDIALWGRILIALGVICALYISVMLGVCSSIMHIKEIKLFKLNDNHSLYVSYGDLFADREHDKNVIFSFAGNRCFDTEVNDNLIANTSIHGQALKRIYEKEERDFKSVHNEIEKFLYSREYKFSLVKSKTEGYDKRYELGAVAEIEGLEKETYFILGLTWLDKNFHAKIDKAEYLEALGKLIIYLQARANGRTVYLPIIGAGLSEVGPAQELLQLMIDSIKIFRGQLTFDIHIVIGEDYKKIIGLLELKKRNKKLS